MQSFLRCLAVFLVFNTAAWGQGIAPRSYPTGNGAVPPNLLPPEVANSAQPLPGTQSTISATQLMTPHPLVETLKENLLTFDPRQTDLIWQDGRWLLMADSVLLKDFGRHEVEGRAALSFVRQQGLNQKGSIGSPRPIMEYWLADGRAPVGPIPGLRTIPIHVEDLRVEESQGQWCVRDATRILLNFGMHSEDANLALQVMQRYGFTQVGYIGQGVPMMLMFLTSTEQAAALTPAKLSTPHLPGNNLRKPLLPPDPITRVSATDASPKGPNSEPTLPPTTPLVTHKPKESHADATARQPRSDFLVAGRQLSQPGEVMTDLDAAAERVPFDWRQVRVRQDGQDWKLEVTGYLIANFGKDEAAARQALSLLQYYRCTEHVLIGGPRPVVSYFLCNGQAPHGMMLGLDGMTFRPDTLVVQRLGTEWVVTDGTRILFNCGDKEQEARHALERIQEKRFDHLVYLGHDPTPVLTFLVKAY
jgi:hypothetical protein